MKDETKKSDLNAETVVVSEERKSMLKRVGIFGAIGLAIFLLGFVPMWLSARSTANERDTAQVNLRLSVLQNNLATAALNARRGEYEQSRQQASSFFTELRSEAEREQSAFTPQQQIALKPILADRDEAITLLARNDPASTERLSDLYFTLLQIRN
ncbi:MAG: hypothetical protein PSX80_05970 [bacterium]|nr:hypothetical protein [bacterium]